MIEPIEIQATEKYRVWLRYSDGASGEVDLSHWAGQGVFQAWEEPGFFQTVRITDYGSIAWGEDDAIEVCPDDLYTKLTGAPIEKLWPGLADAKESKRERRRRLLNQVIADITANNGGLRMADNLPREELYDRARARAEAEEARRQRDRDA